MTSMSEFRAELGAILNCDPRVLPSVFGGQKPRVLKSGILWELVAAFPRADVIALREWLGRYTSSRAYLQATIHGTRRFDVAGRFDSWIGNGQRSRARTRLSILGPPSAIATAAGEPEPVHGK